MDKNIKKNNILQMVQKGEVTPEKGALMLQELQTEARYINDEIIINEKIHIPFEYREYDPSFPTLVLFPGILMRLDSWSFLYEYHKFKNKYNILSFEHRGQWHATKYFNTYESYTIEENSVYLFEIIKKLNLENRKLHLVGISSGCLISLDFAMKYPHLVQSILFFAPLFMTNYAYQDKQRSVVFAIENISDKYFDELLDIFYYDYYSENYIVRNKEALTFFRKNVRTLCKEIPEMMLSIVKIIEAVLEYLITVDSLMPQLEKLAIPKRIIVGEQDVICSPSLLSGIAQQINADIEIIKDTGHVLLLEDESYFLKKIENFILDVYNQERPRRAQQRKDIHIPVRLIIDQGGIQYKIRGSLINQQADSVTGYCFEIINDDNIVIDVDYSLIINKKVTIELDKPFNVSFNGIARWNNKRVLYTTIGIELLE